MDTTEYKEYLNNLKEAIDNHPNKDELKKNIIIADNQVFFVNNRLSPEEIGDLTNEELFYYPVCSKEEIKRIFNVKTASDYLLKLRADSIEDHARHHRVFLKRYNKNKENWSLTNYFNQSDFDKYLDNLSARKKNKCSEITYGYAYLNEANGKCIKTKYGTLIIISEALRYYLFYMNTFLLAPYYRISQPDDFHSFLIALRIMLNSESLDFDLDPRGEIPTKVNKEISQIVDLQIEFVIGHEFAHYLLGHISSGMLEEFRLGCHLFNNIDSPIRFYKYSWEQEYEADFYSIEYANYYSQKKSAILNSAFLFFEGLHLLEVVKKYMNPSPTHLDTHPISLDRLWHLRKRISKKHGYSEKRIKDSIKNIYQIEKILKEDFLPFNIEELEKYGSVYLPNYRKSVLIDRIDY